MTCIVCGSETINSRKTCSSQCLTQFKKDKAKESWAQAEVRQKMVQGITSDWAENPRTRSEEAREKTSRSLKGRVITPEHARKISDSLKGTFHGKPARGWMLDDHGYIILTQESGHPLVKVGNQLALHRKVLYEKIGPGSHRCTWCEKELEWGGWFGIQGDHLDGDITNNHPENIVPSCGLCNRTGARLRSQL